MLAGVLSSPYFNTQSTLKGATAFDVCFPLHIVSAFIIPPLILWFYEKNLISPFKFHAPEGQTVTRALFCTHPIPLPSAGPPSLDTRNTHHGLGIPHSVFKSILPSSTAVAPSRPPCAH